MPDVLTIGNALVDVLDHEDDAFLAAHDLVKGSMHLVDAERSKELYDAMGPGIEASGGCAANTATGVVSLGGSAAFIGKVRDDQLGAVYRHDLKAVGVEDRTDPSPGIEPSLQLRARLVVERRHAGIVLSARAADCPDTSDTRCERYGTARGWRSRAG